MEGGMAKVKRFWKIIGRDGANEIFERVCPLGRFSEERMVALLQRLASKSLTEDEIIDASLPKNANCYASHLEPMKNGGGPGGRGVISVGRGVYYFASVWRADELRQDQVQ